MTVSAETPMNRRTALITTGFGGLLLAAGAGVSVDLVLKPVEKVVVGAGWTAFQTTARALELKIGLEVTEEVIANGLATLKSVVDSDKPDSDYAVADDQTVAPENGDVGYGFQAIEKGARVPHWSVLTAANGDSLVLVPRAVQALERVTTELIDSEDYGFSATKAFAWLWPVGGITELAADGAIVSYRTAKSTVTIEHRRLANKADVEIIKVDGLIARKYPVKGRVLAD